MGPLKPYAACDETTRGRHHPEPSPPFRSEYQRDRDRIIHCGAFRRLEYKTQVFVNHEGDLYRTRLTHSIEVAQIARSIARALQVNEDLTEAIALAHDLGHTPFGHAGQDALNHCMRDHGGFEHNLQSLRVVDELEQRYADFYGLNLTFETREGILKHSSLPNAGQLGDVGKRFLDGSHACLEAQLTNLADEIAYNSHDVDDGLRSGMITLEQLSEVQLFGKQLQKVTERYPDLDNKRTVHEIVRRIINDQVVDLITTSQAALQNEDPATIDDVRQAPATLIRFSPDMREQNLELKRFLRTHLYKNYRVHRMSAKAEKVISSLYTSFMSDPGLLPPVAGNRTIKLEKENGLDGKARGIADYIAGMTDRYALREYERLFDPASLT